MICVHYEGFSSCNFVSFVDRPNYNLAKVFFVALRGPSWIKKVFSPALRGQTKLRPYKGFLRDPSRPFADKKVFSPALRGQTKPRPCKGFLRGPSRPFVDQKKVFSEDFRG